MTIQTNGRTMYTMRSHVTITLDSSRPSQVWYKPYKPSGISIYESIFNIRVFSGLFFIYIRHLLDILVCVFHLIL